MDQKMGRDDSFKKKESQKNTFKVVVQGKGNDVSSGGRRMTQWKT